MLPARLRATPRTFLAAGMTAYLDAGALVTSAYAIGGPYVDVLSLDGDDVGLALGGQTLAFALGAAVGGRLADVLGRRTVLMHALAVYLLGVVVLATATSAEAAVVGAVVIGLGIGADLPASLSMLRESAPAGRRSTPIAAAQLLWGLGIGVAGVSGLLLADLGALGARLMLAHLAVVAALVLLLRRAVPETAEWVRARATPTPPDPVPVRTAALLTGAYYVLWLVGAQTLGAFKTYLWIQELNGDPRLAPVLVMLGVPLGLAGSVVLARVVDTAHRPRWVALGAAGTVAGWTAFSVHPSRPTFVFLVAMGGVSASLAGEALYKIATQERVGTLRRGTVQGATMAVARIVAGAFALVVPALAAVSLVGLALTVLITQVAAAVIGVGWLARRTAEDAVV